jgi:hypothetical protein
MLFSLKNPKNKYGTNGQQLKAAKCGITKKIDIIIVLSQ